MSIKNIIEYPKLNSHIAFWKSEFGHDMSGAPIWKTGKYVTVDEENLFVVDKKYRENISFKERLNRPISENREKDGERLMLNVSRWEYI